MIPCRNHCPTSRSLSLLESHGPRPCPRPAFTQSPYTLFTDLYNSLAYIALLVAQAVYTIYVHPWCLIQ